MNLTGIHHLTAISAAIRDNRHFYTQTLGMRLVKRSVNQDDVSAKQKAKIVIELRQQHSLAGLLQAAGLSRSTFYYQQKVLQLADQYADVKERIGVIYAQHKGRYGYRRITAMLKLGAVPSITRQFRG